MIIETIELKKIHASDGFVLTNGTNYTKMLVLSKTDSIDNWYEITDAEYAVILENADKEEKYL
jgi:hypothetical protein